MQVRASAILTNWTLPNLIPCLSNWVLISYHFQYQILLIQISKVIQVNYLRSG